MSDPNALPNQYSESISLAEKRIMDAARLLMMDLRKRHPEPEVMRCPFVQDLEAAIKDWARGSP